jgi:hypothetical protein
VAAQLRQPKQLERYFTALAEIVNVRRGPDGFVCNSKPTD